MKNEGLCCGKGNETNKNENKPNDSNNTSTVLAANRDRSVIDDAVQKDGDNSSTDNSSYETASTTGCDTISQSDNSFGSFETDYESANESAFGSVSVEDWSTSDLCSECQLRILHREFCFNDEFDADTENNLTDEYDSEPSDISYEESSHQYTDDSDLYSDVDAYYRSDPESERDSGNVSTGDLTGSASDDNSDPFHNLTVDNQPQLHEDENDA